MPTQRVTFVEYVNLFDDIYVIGRHLHMLSKQFEYFFFYLNTMNVLNMCEMNMIQEDP